jgi:O-methyltransferase domain/Dimerisation domain
MTQQAPATPLPSMLLGARDGLILHQTLYVAAKLGVADLLQHGWRSAAELARELEVDEGALYRSLRLLASQGIFEENDARCFRNTQISSFLRTGVPGSVRSLFIFWGSDFFYPCFGQIMHSVRTGEPARTLLSGSDGFELLRRDPELARIFDDAMTNASELVCPAIAAAYDFGAWGSLMDVGGGNGILLAHILRTYPRLRGVLADQQHVLDRARERGYLSGDLEARTTMEPCNFFEQVPAGCKAYLMKSVIHDWDNKQARIILANCRKVIPADGVLLLVEWELSVENVPSPGKFIDIVMLVLTGGQERTVEEYRELLASTGFQLSKVVPTPAQFSVIEAFPV